ncbi:MAG: PAS domain S-box protein, partial [Leptolyngbya sp. SIO1D8]|nr:PAS domain S-box protein [Leptolyngbya sp. SIO1D8]
MTRSRDFQQSEQVTQEVSPISSSLESAVDLQPLRITPDTPLIEVVTLMSLGERHHSSTFQNLASDSAQPRIKRSSYVLVIEGEHLLGILTERDVVKLAAQGIEFRNTSVADVMTQQLVTLQVSDLRNSSTALTLFQQHNIRHLPILHESGQVMGVVTQRSLRRTLQSADLLRLRRVKEIMSTRVISASPETTVLELVKIMASHRVSCVVIMQPKASSTPADPLPSGILTERDIVRFQSLGLNLSTLHAQAVMSKPLRCLCPDDDLWSAHQIMEQLGVRRLVVTDAQNTLVGIVTQSSILAALDPLEMQHTIKLLQQQVAQLQDERVQWLRVHATQLENQIQTTEQRFRAIFNQTFQFIGLLEPNGTLIEANQTALDFGGLQREEVINRPFWEAHWWKISPETQAQLKQAIAQAAQGNFVRYEVDVLGVDRIITIDFSLRPIRDETGQVKLLIPEGRDISDLKQVEAALRQSKQRYANLAKVAPVGIFQTDAEGNYLYINDLWCKIAGIVAEEAQGTGWVQGLHLEDRAIVMAEWSQAVQTKQPFCLEYRFQAPTGEVTWVLGQAVAEMDADGNVNGYIGTITNITERKQAETALQASEARLKEAQRIAHIGSWEFDFKTNTLLWSDEIYRIFEIDPQQFGATYEAFLSTVHPDDRDWVHQAYTASVNNQTPYNITHRLLMADGRIKFVQERCRTFYDENNQPLRSIGTVQDVTVRQQTEDRLHYQLAQAKLVAQISTRFSHLNSAELDVGIQQTLQEIAEFSQMDTGFLIQFSQPSQMIDITHEWVVAGLPSQCAHPSLSFSVLPWMAAKTQQGEVLCVPNVANLPTEAAKDKAYWQTLGINSLIAIPIYCQNDVISWISCASRRVKSCSEFMVFGEAASCFFKAIELLKLVGEIFANTLRRRRTEIELHRYQHHLEDLVASRTSELRESETRFRTMADTAPVLIWVSDIDQRCTYFNQGWLEFTGCSLEAALGNGWVESIHPDDLESCLDTYLTAFATRQPFQIEYRRRRFDAEYRWVLDIGAPRFLPTGAFAGYVGSCIDITERRHMAQELFREKELAQVTLHCIGDAVITTDAQGQVEYFNPVAERLTGWPSTEARGRLLTEVFNIFHEATREPAENPVARVLQEGCITGLANDTVLVSRQGTKYSIEDSAAPIRDRTGRMIGTVMVFHDVTQSRRLANRLLWQASHDTLTGLANRRQFEQILTETLQDAQQEAQVHVLCYLDLDQFKVVNDTCGHTAGDELLRQISRLLKSKIRTTDTLARLGGDEFGILLRQCPLEQAE